MSRHNKKQQQYAKHKPEVIQSRKIGRGQYFENWFELFYNLITFPFRYPKRFFFGLLFLMSIVAIMREFGKQSYRLKTDLFDDSNFKLLSGNRSHARTIVVGEDHA